MDVILNGYFFFAEALISRAAYRQRLEAGTKWEKYQHIENGKGRQKLDLEYRMVCSAPYYGSDCNTYCKPRNDQYGHYNCDAQGVKQCLPGWQKDSDNSYCTKRKSSHFFPSNGIIRTYEI